MRSRYFPVERLLNRKEPSACDNPIDSAVESEGSSRVTDASFSDCFAVLSTSLPLILLFVCANATEKEQQEKNKKAVRAGFINSNWANGKLIVTARFDRVNR